MDSMVIQVSSSHLYRGMHLRATCEVDTRCLLLERRQNIAVLLLFEDGSYAPADLVHGKGGRVVLHVPAYTTARGTSMAARTWTVKAIEERGDGFDIHLGSRSAT